MDDAEAPRVDRPAAATDEPVASDEPVVHILLAGQTLWRVATAYGIGVDELADANGIDDPTQVAAGTALVIPGATSAVEVAPYPMAPTRRAESRPPIDGGPWIWPVEGGRVLSPFGAPRRTHRHAGIDIDGEHGQPVRAARAGTVTFRGTMRGYGMTVIVDHGDGFRTLYAHNAAVTVDRGDHVERGQTIARVGRTGNASGDHCHFEIRTDDGPVDPLAYLGTVAGGLGR